MVSEQARDPARTAHCLDLPKYSESRRSRSGIPFLVNEFGRNATLQLEQEGRVLYEKKFSWLRANVALSLGSEWVQKVDFGKEPVKLVIRT